MQAQPNAAVFCDFSAQSWQTMYNGQGPYATDGTFQTVDSSAGPSRVLTRRQRALAHEHRPYDIQRATMYMPNSASRPQTPPNSGMEASIAHHDFNQAQTRREFTPSGLSPLSMPQGMQSPYNNPLTPSTTSSPYTTYSFFGHSRANSLSAATNRAASPALSTVSALTSVSSASAPTRAPNSTSSSSSFGLSSTSGSPLSGSASTSASASPQLGPLRQKQKKQRLFNMDRKAICEYAVRHPTARQEDIARQYGVERSTISKILKNKTKWLNVPVDEELKIAKHRPSKFPEIETDMMDVLLAARDNNAPLTDAFIRIKAREVALKLGIGEDRFKASAGWVENFKHRHGIKGGIWSGHGRNVRAAASRGAGLDPILLGGPLPVSRPRHSPDPMDPSTEIPATGPSWLMAPVEPPPGVHPSSAPVSQSPNTPDEIAPVVDAASWMMSNAPPPPSHDDPGNLSGWLTQPESAQSSVDEAAWISPNHNGEMAADQLSSNQHSANAPWPMQQTTNDDEQPPSKAHANLAFNFVTDYLRQCGQELDPQLAAAVSTAISRGGN
ncbi:unnamed protein product [Mycena citricolor]|uniref:HTH CENPB-type domain-containing protein n=1 Tax=Mycena citricolor TaxID=2018698 RepID=A0AAD2HZM7_9AGAR|nr:unnamed protein product [Mycena citricolor]